MKRHYTNKNKYKNNFVLKHIRNNYNYYIISFLFFTAGIIIGVILLNNLPKSELNNIHTFITDSVLKIKQNVTYSKFDFLKDSILKNFFITLIIWLIGITILGKYLLYFITFVLGIYFGYTVSSIMYSLPFAGGLLFLLSSMFLQNIIKIPAFVFLCAEGSKMHSELKYHNNLKKFLVKFTFCCVLILFVLIISSFVEVYISGNLLLKVSKYI